MPPNNMTKTFKAIIFILAIAVAVCTYAIFQVKPANLGAGQAFYEVPDFIEGLNAGSVNRYFAVTRTGSTTVPAIRVGTGSYIKEHSCSTLTWNPAAFSSSTQATTTITLTGAALGDIVLSSFDSATSTELWYSRGKVTSANTVTAGLFPANSAVVSTNLSTSTLRVCYFAY
jgi:hypothetical protein